MYVTSCLQMGLRSLLFCVYITSIWCLTLDPYPTANVTRYNSQSFNCSVDPNWVTVSYNCGSTNIAFFVYKDGKCKDFAAPPPGLYITDCDDSTRTFYLIINNVTDVYNGTIIQCNVVYSTDAKSEKESLINVQYQPTTLPTITQTPVGPIIEGNKVTLTCTIQGGNPVATITWSCDEASQIIPTGSPSTVDTISSVELVTSKNNNGQICTCTGRHLLWTDDKTQQHNITVYYEPTSTPNIIQTPPGPINESSTVILKCDIKGGNPLATITWTCEGWSSINLTGSPPTNTTTSSVELTVNSNDNGKVCTCIGHHPVWTMEKTTVHTLNVRYKPTTSPTMTQTPVGPIIVGNKVTLTCTIQGGNPVAMIMWSCDGANQITPTGSPSTVDAISSVEFVTSKDNNGQICICTGRHILWTNDKTQQHTITVYYDPTSTPSIIQTPSSPINENSAVILTCDIKGGNPLAIITWMCEGSSPINSTGSPPINTVTSSVQLTVNSSDNGRICTCIGHHTVWKTDKTTGHILDVRYQPTTSPTITQTPVGPVIEGNKVTLTCTIQGGNPVATITWFCNGGTQITPTGSPSTVDAISSVELVTSKNNNGHICTCTGRHILWTNEKIQQHTITVYYEPTTTPSIIQTPPGPINENSTVILTCNIQEGNPLATIIWTCSGSSPINPTGSSPTNTSTYSVQLTVNSNDNGRICTCIGNHQAWTTNKTTGHTLDVRYQPTTSPTITQTPSGPIIKGNKVTLTCTIQGGNPVATITWSCDGATQITPTGSPSTVDAISSIELITSKENNGHICTCTGRHLLWTNDKIQQHTITVYYEPTATPYIIQIPQGPINESSTVILTCDIKGGNPLATITWMCEGSSPIPPTGSPPTNTATSSVQLTVNSNDNGRMCTCIGHHTVWTTDKTTGHTLDVRYQATTSPTITQTPSGPIIEGNKVTLICTIQGGNPVATITWSCDGAPQITPTGSPSTVDAISSVELITSKENNGHICACTGRHILWTNDKIQQHTIIVYYHPRASISLDTTIAITSKHRLLNITVPLISYPRPTLIRWTFIQNGTTDQTDVDNTYITTTYGVYQHVSQLIKDGVTDSEYGLYSINVSNNIDPDFTHKFQVVKENKPTAPTVFYVVCKTTSAVVLWRSEFNGGSKQGFYVQNWRISQSSPSTLSPFIPDPGVTADLQYTVNNLVPDTIYMFQIIARNYLGDSLSKSVTCTTDQIHSQTKPAAISQDNNGLFAGGISSLIIGLMSIIFSLSFVVICRSRLQKREQMRTNDYTEFRTCTHCNPVLTDNYDSLNTTAIGAAGINESQTEKTINAYEECQPVTKNDHTYNSLNEQPKEQKKLKKKEEIYDNMKI